MTRFYLIAGFFAVWGLSVMLFRWGLRRHMKKLMVVWLWAWSAGAAVLNSPTADETDVKNTCAAANPGDTVIVPAGNVGWSGGSPNLTLNKNIKLIGSGIGVTIITNANSALSGTPMISWTLSNDGNQPMLSGFEFRGVPGQSNPNDGIVLLDGTCFVWRCCSNEFNLMGNRGIQHHGWINGVYDHNVQYGGFKQFIEVWHDGYGGGQFGDLSWNDPDFSGTTNGVYFEDNLFIEVGATMSAAMDIMGGGREFIRHNIFSNCVASTHGTESTGRQRSVRLMEIYTNQFYVNAAAGVGSFTSGIYRGGSGVVFGNTYTYQGPNPFANWFGMNLVCYREISQFNHWGGANGTNGYDLLAAGNPFDSGTHTGGAGATVLTDGTKAWTVNGWTTNILWNVTKNLASRIVANTGTTITYDTSGPSISGGTLLTFDPGDVYRVMAVNAALDQPGRGQQATPFAAGSDPATVQTWQGEALDPIYSGGNTLNGFPGMDVASGYPSILSGRDYNPNSAKPGWVALVYPHPLVNGGVAPPSPASSIARITTLRVGKAVVAH